MNNLSNSYGEEEETMHLETCYVWETLAFQVIPNHFFEKVIRLQRAQEGDSGSISFAAFRLYEPKSREGVLGPDLRVLILLEYGSWG